MDAFAEDRDKLVTIESMSARVLADARRSFAAQVDTTMLEHHVNDVVGQLWTDATKVTTFIPVLALRDLRDRLDGGFEPSPAP